MESPITTLTNAIKHWAYDVFSAKEATADAQATADEARAAAGDAQAMASVTVVTLTEAEDGTVTADMTVDEVAELVGSGRRVVAVTPFYNRVTIDQVTKTTSNRNSVLGTLLNGNVTTRVTGAVLVSGDKWTASETDVNTADRTYVGDFYISVDASNGAIKTSGPHSDGTSRSRTMALATDLTALSTRVDALEGAGGGGAFVVKFTTDSSNTTTADKTQDEIWDALNAGTQVVGVMENGSGSGFTRLFLNVVQQMAANGVITFSALVPMTANSNMPEPIVAFMEITVDTNDVVTMSSGQLQMQLMS